MIRSPFPRGECQLVHRPQDASPSLQSAAPPAPIPARRKSNCQCTGSSSRYTGSSSRYIGSSSQCTGSSSRYIGSSSQYIGSGSQYTGSGSQYTGSGSRYIGSGSQYIGNGSQCNPHLTIRQTVSFVEILACGCKN